MAVVYIDCFLAFSQKNGGRGSSVGRAHDSCWGGPGFNVCCGITFPTGWVGHSIMWPAETEVMVPPPPSPALSRVWQHIKLSDASHITLPGYSLVVDEDVKKRNKQTNLTRLFILLLVNDYEIKENGAQLKYSFLRSSLPKWLSLNFFCIKLQSITLVKSSW